MNGESPKEIAAEAQITVRNLTLGYGSVVLMRDLNFTVKRGDVFIIMGGSGCGKSTLLRHMIGSMKPTSGTVNLFASRCCGAPARARTSWRRDFATMRSAICFFCAWCRRFRSFWSTWCRPSPVYG